MSLSNSEPNGITTVKETEDVQYNSSVIVRFFRMLYGGVGYVASMVSLVYFILFINDLFIPASVNSGPYEHTFILAFSINVGLLSLFGLQHSIMARPKFKLWLKTLLHPSIERSTYCLGTGLALVAVCYGWAPLEGQVWSVEHEWLVWGLRLFAGFGWLLLVVATFNIGHFELFGLRQIYRQFIGKNMPIMQFKMKGLYKWIRHPIQTGLLIGMWSVPYSSVTHFMLAFGMTIYIFIGLYFEEKDLIKEYGQTYLEYIQKVGKVIPFL